ncbi:hypothetical protein ACFLZV_07225, partial [Candidatus Margulisiibacteriota bacterium]
MHLFSERNQKILNGIIVNKSSAGSYIFYGQSGSFIFEAAEYFAQGLNCLSFKDQPCTVCDNCISIQNRSFPDFVKIEVADKIKIEQVRQVQEIVKYGPAQGSYLCVIIPDAQNFTQGAANALLKTLEEPPANVIFILLTNNLLALLPTIRSRSQQLDFPSVSYEKLAMHLEKNYPEKEKILAQCHHNQEFVKYFLENNEYIDMENISFTELKNHTVQDRLNLAGNLAKNKKQGL